MKLIPACIIAGLVGAVGLTLFNGGFDWLWTGGGAVLGMGITVHAYNSRYGFEDRDDA